MQIPAYPYQQYLTISHTVAFNLSMPRLDWQAFERDSPQPALRRLSTLVLENEYLKLTVLPELGGRLYQAVFKPTGHGVFYNNPVLKPSHWGHESQGWWLAAGGMEWGLPVEEHGYEWGVPWQYGAAMQGDLASITVWDSRAADRLRAGVTIALRAGEASFTVSPRLENPTAQTVRYQFWLNGMVSSSGTNKVSEGTEFILPASQVTVHSTGDRTLPLPGQSMSWPQYNGRSLNLYGAWRSFLGIFARPQAQDRFMGAYDHIGGEGVLRIFPPAIAPGAKIFGSKGLGNDQWTDGDSSYVELHGGVTPTFGDEATLPPGGHIGWTERWYPYLAIGAATAANDEAALSLGAVAGGYRLGVATTAQRSGRLTLLLDGREVWSRRLAVAPDRPFVESVASTAPGRPSLRFEDEAGKVIIER